MAEIGYLLARLPAVDLDTTELPIGPEDFAALTLGGELGGWVSGVLDWLRIANWQNAARKLPVPYPEASSAPLTLCHRDPWSGYYLRMTSITAPSIVSGWAREDAALIAARSRARGRRVALPIHVGRPRPGTVSGGGETLANARVADRDSARAQFAWLDEQLLASAPLSQNRIYAYAIRLVILVRNGRRASHGAP